MESIRPFFFSWLMSNQLFFFPLGWCLVNLPYPPVYASPPWSYLEDHSLPGLFWKWLLVTTPFRYKPFRHFLALLEKGQTTTPIRIGDLNNEPWANDPLYDIPPFASCDDPTRVDLNSTP